jgi:hypothetical protein
MYILSDADDFLYFELAARLNLLRHLRFWTFDPPGSRVLVVDLDNPDRLAVLTEMHYPICESTPKVKQPLTLQGCFVEE